jgi:hypothetical protein
MFYGGFTALLAIAFLVVSAMMSMFGSSEDGFADNLTIPDNVKVSVPLTEQEEEPGKGGDAFQQAVMEALKTPGVGRTTVKADLTNLTDTHELFFSNTHFTVYEGDWGKPCAARFEIWFVPDSGAPERKLMEKVFKIEGWQR